jgi:hypothetical protein
VKLAAKTSANALSRRFARLQDEIEGAALDAAADALAGELAQVRAREDLHAPLMRERDERRRLVGADDQVSIAREFGNPTEAPAPWLAPSPPLARAPMRAAALARVRDVVAAHAGKPKGAVARVLSRMRRK